MRVQTYRDELAEKLVDIAMKLQLAADRCDPGRKARRHWDAVQTSAAAHLVRTGVYSLEMGEVMVQAAQQLIDRADHLDDAGAKR